MYRAELRNWGPSLLQIRHCRPILRHEVEELLITCFLYVARNREHIGNS